jgi:hypothetical protein
MRVVSQQQAATYAAAVALAVVVAAAPLDNCCARMEALHGRIRVSVYKKLTLFLSFWVT